MRNAARAGGSWAGWPCRALGLLYFIFLCCKCPNPAGHSNDSARKGHRTPRRVGVFSFCKLILCHQGQEQLLGSREDGFVSPQEGKGEMGNQRGVRGLCRAKGCPGTAGHTPLLVLNKESAQETAEESAHCVSRPANCTARAPHA